MRIKTTSEEKSTLAFLQQPTVKRIKQQSLIGICRIKQLDVKMDPLRMWHSIQEQFLQYT